MSNIPIPHYQITIKGTVDPSWSDWFEGLVIVSGRVPDGSQVTTLTGAIQDQAALRGLLIRLWDLNFHLISVQQFYPPVGTGTREQCRPLTGSVDNNARNCEAQLPDETAKSRSV